MKNKIYMRKVSGSYNPDYPSSDHWELMVGNDVLVRFNSVHEMEECVKIINDQILKK